MRDPLCAFLHLDEVSFFFTKESLVAISSDRGMDDHTGDPGRFAHTQRNRVEEYGGRWASITYPQWGYNWSCNSMVLPY